MTQAVSNRQVTHDRAGEFEEFGRPPHPALVGQVLNLGGFVDHGSAPVLRRELPLVGTPIILSFGSPFRVSDARNPDLPVHEESHFVAGLHENYSTTVSTGASWLMQLDLTPLGAIGVFGMPLHDLSNRVVSIEDVLGRDGSHLISSLERSATWTERFDLVEALLLKRLSVEPRVDDAIRWSWDQLQRSAGTVPIGVLADETGWSRRHFAARFRHQIGLSPKLVARQLRFTSAASMLVQTNHSLAHIANRLDYADQAHFSRKFREFAGESPAQFRAAQSASE